MAGEPRRAHGSGKLLVVGLLMTGGGLAVWVPMMLVGGGKGSSPRVVAEGPGVAARASSQAVAPDPVMEGWADPAPYRVTAVSALVSGMPAVAAPPASSSGGARPATATPATASAPAAPSSGGLLPAITPAVGAATTDPVGSLPLGTLPVAQGLLPTVTETVGSGLLGGGEASPAGLPELPLLGEVVPTLANTVSQLPLVPDLLGGTGDGEGDGDLVGDTPVGGLLGGLLG